MARVDLHSEVLEQMSKKMGFVASYYRKNYDEVRVSVDDLIEEIKELRLKNHVLADTIEKLREGFHGKNFGGSLERVPEEEGFKDSGLE